MTSIHNTNGSWTYHQTILIPSKEQKDNHTCTQKIQIPTSGYYTLSFGTEQHLDEFETIHVDSAKEGDVKYCGCTCTLHWSTPSSSCVSSRPSSIPNNNNDKAHLSSHRTTLLPLRRTLPKQNQISYITSRRIASIMYLTKGTEFYLDPLNSCTYSTTSSLQKNQEYLCCCGPFQLTLKLYLDQDVATRLEKQKANHYESMMCKKQKYNHETQFTITDDMYFDSNPIEYKKKPWVCVECRRCFDSPKATRNHCISKHAPRSPWMKCNHTHTNEDYSDLIGPEIFHIPLRAVYQDDDIAIIVKPQGIPVQGGRWTINSTDLLLPFCAKKGTDGALSKPRTTHRLDSATGGLVVIAKTHESETRMNQMFEMKLCKKRYRAIVFGKLILNQHDYSELSAEDRNDEFEGFGIIHAYIGDKPSLTRYQIVSTSPCNHPMAKGFITTVDLWPITGRTHQLRKHLQMIGHPIWGDLRYASYDKDERNRFKAKIDLNAPFHENPHCRMCLWALEICFPHPVKPGQTVQAMLEEPEFYQELRDFSLSTWEKGADT